MQVIYNTDKTIASSQAAHTHFTNLISENLDRFSAYITKVEAYVTDENGPKDGPDAIRCVIEARLEGKAPVAVNHHADNEAKAVIGAIDKMKGMLDSIIGRSRTH